MNTTIDLTQVVIALIGLCSALITGYLIPYIRSKLTTEQEKKLRALVKVAVAAAEQIFKGSNLGEQKKQYVINWLTENGINVDSQKLDAIIESTVYEVTKELGLTEGE